MSEGAESRPRVCSRSIWAADYLLKYPCEPFRENRRGVWRRRTQGSELGSFSRQACCVSADAGRRVAGRAASLDQAVEAPDYLTAYYWWAYVHPLAVRVFERQWLVNLILWGNYARLRDAALSELGDVLPGRTLQVACAYGDLTGKLSARMWAPAAAASMSSTFCRYS